MLHASDMDMECSTPIKDTCNINYLQKRMPCIKIEWSKSVSMNLGMDMAEVVYNGVAKWMKQHAKIVWMCDNNK